MRIAVSGATGNTGVSVVENLSKKGHEVVAISRSPDSAVSKRLASLPGVTVVTIENAFKKPIDRAYVCFAPTRTMFSDETDFLRDLRKANVKYIVKLATAEYFMDDALDKRFYARSHIAIENILEKGTIPFTSLRANLFMTWTGADYAGVKKTKTFKTMAGATPVACIHPDDIGLAVATLLSLPDPSAHYGKKYNLSGPEDLTGDSMAKDFSEVLGEKITFDTGFTDDEYVGAFVQMGLKQHEADHMRGTLAEFHTGKLTLASAPTSPALLSLVPPSTTFKQFLQTYYAENK